LYLYSLSKMISSPTEILPCLIMTTLTPTSGESIPNSASLPFDIRNFRNDFRGSNSLSLVAVSGSIFVKIHLGQGLETARIASPICNFPHHSSSSQGLPLSGEIIMFGLKVFIVYDFRWICEFTSAKLCVLSMSIGAPSAKATSFSSFWTPSNLHVLAQSSFLSRRNLPPALMLSLTSTSKYLLNHFDASSDPSWQSIHVQNSSSFASLPELLTGIRKSWSMPGADTTR